ncbi:RNA-binding transcriptional accessory protein, partial [Saprospiraceae bacterium]|nr:RNA-binding transcriptional accessory protein [Saprospiraceae bacterium]
MIDRIARSTNISLKQVESVLNLFDEGATIAFVARYRKERTGSLDEVQLRLIQSTHKELSDLLLRKASIKKSIEEQGQWTEKLAQAIDNCWNTQELEDIYLPYKRRRKTKADKARENGLDGLAKIIMSQRSSNLEHQARGFMNSEIKTIEEALQGARYIIAEWMNEDISLRNQLRRQFDRFADLHAKLIKSKQAEAQTYRDYWDYQESLKRVPSHRLLAVRRAEEEGLLRVSIKVDNDRAIESILRRYLKKNKDENIELAAKDAWKRLLYPSLENEYAKASKTKADQEAIEVFTQNLSQLLLEAPLGQKKILAIDPGFRTGCKVVALNDVGDLKEYANIYPHPPQNKSFEAANILFDLIEKHKIEAIAIGNGTAGRETEAFLKKHLKDGQQIELFLISEAGASIYSASEVARLEFPDLDLTIRGAISIGRRLMDPLAELVKIDAKSIGVGQYQHDVQQDLLRQALDETVVSCVNQVGINLNTASASLLSYVSGIGPVLANNIMDYRSKNGDFTRRKELLKVKGLGPKAYEQAAGFLRIKNSDDPLDNSGIHPERYKLVKSIAKDNRLSLDQILGHQEAIESVTWKNYVSDDVGMPSLQDIAKELAKPGLDPRGKAEVFHFHDTIQSIDDLTIGEELPGIISNITKFGAFVDIGIKENGLVH